MVSEKSRLKKLLTSTASKADKWVQPIGIKKMLDEAIDEGWSQEIKREIDLYAVAHGYYFDEEDAQRAVDFFEKFLVHGKGRFAGENFALLDWQKNDVIRPMFGWKRPNGLRRFSTVYVEIPKKNGKTTMMAGLALYFLVADGEEGGEVYAVASERNQAAMTYRSAKMMRDNSPDLKSHISVTDSTKTMLHTASSSIFGVMSSDVSSSEGKDAHAILFDELHAQKKPDLYNSVRWAGSAREQPMLFMITTAGHEKHSICYENHTYGEQVLEFERHDMSFLPVIYKAPDDADWSKEETWFMANPSLGHTMTVESFRDAYEQAKATPTSQSSFRRYRLNQWVEQDNPWLNILDWDKCKDASMATDYTDYYAAVDLSASKDMTAYVEAFPLPDGTIGIYPMFFMPEDSIKDKEEQDVAPYKQWAKDGYITLTPGNIVDQAYLEDFIKERAQGRNLREIAFDPWNATYLMTNLMNDGINCIEFRQGPKTMSPACKMFESMVLQKKVKHDGNPVLRWNMKNIRVEADKHENIKPVKVDRYKRIDGAVASIMAVDRAYANEQNHTYSGDVQIVFI